MCQTSQVWWHVPAIPGLRRLSWEGLEFEASLDHRARPCLKQSHKQTKINGPKLRTENSHNRTAHKGTAGACTSHQRNVDDNGAYLWRILEGPGCLVAGEEDGLLGWVIACCGSGVDLVPLRFCIS